MSESYSVATEPEGTPLGSGGRLLGGRSGVHRRGVGEPAAVPGDRPGGAVPVLHPDPADSAFIDPGRGRGPADRLGLAVAVCTLPWLGFVPDDVASAPPAALARLAEQPRVPLPTR